MCVASVYTTIPLNVAVNLPFLGQTLKRILWRVGGKDRENTTTHRDAGAFGERAGRSMLTDVIRPRIMTVSSCFFVILMICRSEERVESILVGTTK